MTAPNRYRGQDTWKIRKGCTDKRRFSDEITARVGGQIQCQNDGKPAMWVYPCDHCRGWHITNKHGAKRRLVTAEAAYPDRGQRIRAANPESKIKTPQFGGYWGG